MSAGQDHIDFWHNVSLGSFVQCLLSTGKMSKDNLIPFKIPVDLSVLKIIITGQKLYYSLCVRIICNHY